MSFGCHKNYEEYLFGIQKKIVKKSMYKVQGSEDGIQFFLKKVEFFDIQTNKTAFFCSTKYPPRTKSLDMKKNKKWESREKLMITWPKEKKSK